MLIKRLRRLGSRLIERNPAITISFIFILSSIIITGIKPAVAHAGFFSFLERIFQPASQRGEQTEPAFFSSTRTELEASLISSADLFLKPAPANAPEQILLTDLSFTDDSALIPSVGPLGNIAEAQEIKSSRITTYTVREGDTLSEIASAFHISVATLIWANDIKKVDTIAPGQTLVILPVTGVQYTIKRGDTIGGVVKRFGGDTEEIIRINRLPADGTLVAGEIILIPDGELRIARPIPSTPLRNITTPSLGSQQEFVGYYLRPIAGGRKTQGLHGYNGVDLANTCGSMARASAPGTVIIARESGWNGGYGRYVVIDHSNNTQTLYAHLGSVSVGTDWHVAQGQQIGVLGSSGLSTGCHIHFEIRGAKNPF